MDFMPIKYSETKLLKNRGEVISTNLFFVTFNNISK